MTSQNQEEPRGRRAFAAVVLGVVTLCGYYVYSSLTPLVDVLISQLGLSRAAVASLQSLFYLGCTVPVFVAGRLADISKGGLRKVGVTLSSIFLGGALLALTFIKFGMPKLGIGAGRFVSGFAVESLVVVIMAQLASSFPRASHPIVFGLNTAWGRLGTVLAFLSAGWIGPGGQAIQTITLLAVFAGAISVIGMALFDPPNDAQAEFSPIAKSKLEEFPSCFWIYAVGGAAFYGAYYGFEVFSQHYLVSVFHWPAKHASQYSSLLPAVPALLTPFVGRLLAAGDQELPRRGLRLLFMVMAVLELPIGLMLMRSSRSPVTPLIAGALVLMGLAIAMFVPAFWAELVRFAPADLQGTVIGTFTLVQMGFQALVVIGVAVYADVLSRGDLSASLLTCVAAALIALPCITLGLRRRVLLQGE